MGYSYGTILLLGHVHYLIFLFRYYCRYVLLFTEVRSFQNGSCASFYRTLRKWPSQRHMIFSPLVSTRISAAEAEARSVQNDLPWMSRARDLVWPAVVFFLRWWWVRFRQPPCPWPAATTNGRVWVGLCTVTGSRGPWQESIRCGPLLDLGVPLPDTAGKGRVPDGTKQAVGDLLQGREWCDATTIQQVYVWW